MKPSDLIRYAAALVLLSIPIFYNLGELPIKIWDESRLAMNALEMYANHQFLVVHFDGQPEMWSTKPPLMIWLQVFSIRIFGFSEFAIRFPSALAALFTCLTLVVVAHRYLKNYWLGLAAALILLTTHHYMGHHVIRTGDYDSLLILFLTLMSFSVFLFAERDQPKYLLAAFLFFGMAVATKGVASILIVPGLLLYLILRRKFLPVFRLRVFWYGVGWVLLILLILYGGRELLNPGYLRAVFENEIGGRYFEVNEGHVGGPLYYFGVLHQDYWPWFLPVVLFTLFSAKKDKMYRVSFFSGIVALCFLFFVSAAKTKLYWYVAPAYPFLALLLAIGFYKMFLFVRHANVNQANWFTPLAQLLIVPLAFVPVSRTAAKLIDPHVKDYEAWQYEMSYYFRASQNTGPDLSGYYFLKAQYQPHIDFYVILLQSKGVDVQYGIGEDLQPGDRVIYWEDPVEELLDTLYEFERIDPREEQGQVRRVQIVGDKRLQ